MRDAIALENCEVRANSVVSNSKSLAKLLDSSAAAPQLGHHLATRGQKELGVPVHLMKVGVGSNLRNKSKTCLTYSADAARLTGATMKTRIRK